MATISENQRNSAGTLATLPGSIKRQISCSRRPIGTSVPEFDEGVSVDSGKEKNQLIR